MKVMGVRELKAHMSEVLDEVSEGQIVEVTKNGRVVARIVPIETPLSPEVRKAALASLDALTEELAQYASEETNVASDISVMRR